MPPRKKYSFLMRAEDHRFIKKYAVYTRIWFTDYGKILLGVLLVSIMVSSPGLHISAYFLPAFIITLLITTIFFAFFSRPQLSVKRLLPPPACAGEHLTYQLIITNTGKHPVRNLLVSENALPYGLYDAPDHKNYTPNIEWLEPQESVVVHLVIRCEQRGIYELPPMLAATSFPSGLLRWPVRVGVKDRLIVYPRFMSQTDFMVPYKRVYQPGGIAVSSNVGDSNEFLTTREYRRGDRLRDIHWGSYARTGRLVVKEYVDEYFIRVGLFLDTELKAKKLTEEFERRISLAAGIADAIAKKDYIIDLFAAGDVLHHFQMGRALAHLENLLELLACIEPVKSVDLNRLQSGLRPFIQQLSSMIILLGDWDEDRARLCRVIEQMGTKLRVIVIRDQPLTLAADRELTIVHSLDHEGLIR